MISTQGEKATRVTPVEAKTRAATPDLSGQVFDERAENEQLRMLLGAERDYTYSLLDLIRKLNESLGKITSSRWWKLRRKYHRFRKLLRGNSGGPRQATWRRSLVAPFTRSGRQLIRRTLKVIFRQLYLMLEEDPVAIVPRNLSAAAAPIPASIPVDPYTQWRALNMPRAVDLLDASQRLWQLSYQPKVSILLPVFNPPLEFFEQTLQSVLDQVYPHWELCIADDASTDPQVRAVLDRLAEREPRVKVVYRPENGHISAATNSALALATGEFCTLLDHDDLLTPDALYQNVVALNRDRTLDLIYSDEDKIDEQGRCFDPHFKPQWCPDNLLSGNYLCHLVVLRTELLRSIGGMRLGFEGSQDHDMLLRYTEQTARIHHIPRVLYHWRSHDQSTARNIEAKPYAVRAGLRAVEEALNRRGEPGMVLAQPGTYSVRYALKKLDRVSILIPTRDQPAVLETCLESIFQFTGHMDFEVVLIDNNSVEERTFDVLRRYRERHGERFRVLNLPIPFNFSRLMNAGAAEARGAYLLLLNNDTEVIQRDWMRAMLEQAQRPGVGCVGVKLLYPDQTVQHAGVVLEPVAARGPACHVFAGAHRDSSGWRNGLRSISNYSAVTAACMMVRREVYRQVGGFDEAFAVEFNDVDFCLRVRQAGYFNLYLPHVSLYHHESLTRGHPMQDGSSRRRHDEEVRLLRQRWQRFIEDDPCFSRHLNLGPQDVEIRTEG